MYGFCFLYEKKKCPKVEMVLHLSVLGRQIWNGLLCDQEFQTSLANKLKVQRKTFFPNIPIILYIVYTLFYTLIKQIFKYTHI